MIVDRSKLGYKFVKAFGNPRDKWTEDQLFLFQYVDEMVDSLIDYYSRVQKAKKALTEESNESNS